MRRFIIFAILFSVGVHCFAQENASGLKTVPKTVYLLIGGSGPFLSVQYDTRFTKKVNGFGFAAGVGYAGLNGTKVLSFPVSINYLIGKKMHFGELATGLTYINGNIKFDSRNNNTTRGFLYHASAGYRYQPAKGFFFRAGVSPIVGHDVFSWWGYAGFGFCF